MQQQQATTGMGGYLKILRRRAWYAIAIAPAVFLVSVFLAFWLPASYESTATILLEPSSIPKDFIQTTVVSYADQKIQVLQGKVLTVETLSKLIKEYDPYPNRPDLDAAAKAQMILEATSTERVDPVTLKPLDESDAFQLHYRNPDPQRAASVTRRLADLFLTYNQRTREEAASAAAGFLQEQARGVVQELAEVDRQLASLKDKYGAAAPDEQGRNAASLDRAQRDLDEIQRQRPSAEEKENTLSIQLSQMSPNLITSNGDLTDVGKVRAALAEAEQRYTPDHPDVKRLRRALKDLLSQPPGAVGGLKANNPDYQRTESERDGARRQVEALRAAETRAKNTIERLEGAQHSAPGVEREFSAVTRRREQLSLRYQSIQDKLQSAQIGESFESEQRGERYTMIRSPVAARTPSSPNRLGLMLLGIVLGSGLTALAVAIAEAMDPSIRDSSDLTQLGNVQVFASLPVILNRPDRVRRNLVLLSVVAAYGVAVVVVGLTVVAHAIH